MSSWIHCSLWTLDGLSEVSQQIWRTFIPSTFQLSRFRSPVNLVQSRDEAILKMALNQYTDGIWQCTVYKRPETEELAGKTNFKECKINVYVRVEFTWSIKETRSKSKPHVRFVFWRARIFPSILGVLYHIWGWNWAIPARRVHIPEFQRIWILHNWETRICQLSRKAQKD